MRKSYNLNSPEELKDQEEVAELIEARFENDIAAGKPKVLSKKIKSRII
jgi:hypothetical protein